MVKGVSLQQLLDCGVDRETAIALQPPINHALATLPAQKCWQWLTRHILQPSQPFALHEELYHVTFADWDANQEPPPAWIPSNEQMQATHIAALIRELHLRTYPELHAWSVQHRAEFWQRMIQRLGIRFQQPYCEVLDCTAGVESPQWLMGARFNIVESCFQARPEAPAIVTQTKGEPLVYWSYTELLTLTNRVANGLVTAGAQPGAAIAIAMPMTAEAVAIYLGIVKAGYRVVSIADSFAASEIATRLRIAGAVAIFTQDVTVRNGKALPLYAKVVAAAAPTAIVVPRSTLAVSLRPGDRDWNDFLSPNEHFTAVLTTASAPTNLLFSSGTTGEPKAIPWTQTTPIKAAADGHLHQDIHAGDVVAWHTNLGWMMGPWLIYASLINRATIALYDGTPCDRGFGRFIQEARVTMLGVVPSLVNTWRSTGCMNGLDWGSIKAFSSTGECSNPQDMLFLMALAGYKPIIEYCGGTEIGGGYLTGTLAQPCSPSTFTTPALGLDIVILDSAGHAANKGEAFIIPPSIGLSTELLNRDHHHVYFADTPPFPVPIRRHGDQLERLPNGYYRAQGRVDDTMNLNGIKVSAAEIEQTLNSVPEISETAAIAIALPDGGPSQLVIYAVPVSQRPPLSAAALQTILQTALKQQLNPLFKIHAVIVIESLPRTDSNKVMRRILRDRYQETTGLLATPHPLLPTPMNFAERMSRLGTESAFEVFARAKALETQGKSIVHLEIGQPDFQTPLHICEAAFQAMKDGHTGYGPAAGLPELRQTIADHISQTRQVDVHADHVIVTPGAKPVLFFTLLALVNAGDQVIYPDPGFPVYESLINFVGAKAVPLPLREEANFRFRLDDLVSAISDRTRLLILNSPQNPTGGLLTEADLAAIAHLAIQHDFYVLSDEIYSRLIYEGAHHSIMGLPGMQERTILLDGHSKTYAMTGWRLGYGVAPQPLVEHITRLMINSNSCTCTFTQLAGIAALQGSQDSVTAMLSAFKQRRDVLVDGLNAIEGIHCIKPAGAFYAFPNVTQLPFSSDWLADYLLESAGVSLLSGTAFGKFGEGYLRISYANSLDNIREALKRIEVAVSQLKAGV